MNIHDIKMKTYQLIGLLLFLCIPLFAQTPIQEQLEAAKVQFKKYQYEATLSITEEILATLNPEKDSLNPTLADAQRLKGAALMRLGQFERSRMASQSAINIYSALKNGSSSISLAETLGNVGVSYAIAPSPDFHKSIEWFNKAIDLLTTMKEEESVELLVKYIGNVGMAYYYLDDYKAATKAYNKGIDLLKQLSKTDPATTGMMQYRLGSIESKKGNERGALIDYQKAIEAFKTVNAGINPMLANLYYSAANSFLSLGDFEKALTYAEQSMSIHNKLLGTSSLEYIYSLSTKAEALYELGRETEAIFTDSTIVTLYEQMGTDFAYYKIRHEAEFANKLSEIKDDPSIAITGLEKAIRQLKIRTEPHQEELARFTMLLGNAYQKNNQHQLAEAQLLKSIERHKAIYDTTSAELFLPYRNLASAYQKEKKYDDALKYYQLAESVVGLDAETKASQLAYPFFVASQLGEKGQLFEQRYFEEHNTTDLQKADALSQRALSLLETTQKGLMGQQSSIALQKRVVPILESRLNLLWDQYQHDKGEEMVQLIFATLERGKAFALRQAVNSANAIQFSGIPDSLIAKETSLSVDISFYEKQLHEQVNPEITNLLFNLNQEYESLLHYFEKTFPQYYQLKYQSTKIELSTIQKQLQPTQCLIEYFVGEHAIYALKLTTNKYHFNKIEQDTSLVNWVTQLRNSLYNRTDDFTEYAHQLHEKLIAPLGTLPEQLIIIPDGTLGYIPFDLLSVNHSEASQFLIEKHSISYNFSASLWLEMKQKKYANKGLLAVAPSFKAFNNQLASRRDNLGQLIFNQKEVDAISGFFESKMLLDTQATLQNFLQLAPAHSLLHLATHAKLDDQSDEYTYLAFYGINDSLQTAKLYLRDLYNLQLPANMVVLSACETGIGKLRSGEGIINLARGFAYAGAKSMVTSLWTANDLSTSQIMTNFYENLKMGQSKDEALRNAKLSFIHTQPDAHPYYWATFVPIGDMAVLEENNQSTQWIIGISVVLLLGIFLFLLKK